MLSRLFVSLLALSALLPAAPLPVRGLHLISPKPAEVGRMTKFIREVLPKEGVNTLVLEIDYRYQFRTHPEVTDADALSLDDARAIAAAAREAKVKLIPLVDLLGHQSLEEEKTTLGLLRSHPELDETVGKYPGNQGIYCRSYCPLHPQLHAVLFDLIDEVLDAFSADTFHAGMDEVFLLVKTTARAAKGRTRPNCSLGKCARSTTIWPRKGGTFGCGLTA